MGRTQGLKNDINPAKTATIRAGNNSHQLFRYQTFCSFNLDFIKGHAVHVD